MSANLYAAVAKALADIDGSEPFLVVPDGGTVADDLRVVTLDTITDYLAGHIFDVRRYGATGDGVDCTDGLQAAVAAADANGAGVVWIPQGEWRFSETLEIAEDRVSLAGAGVGRAVAAATTDGTTLDYRGTGSAILVSAASNNHLSGFHLDGTNSGSGADGITFNYEGATTSFVQSAERIFCTGFADAFHFYGIEEFEGRHLTAYQPTGVGFFFGAPTGATTSISNRFSACRALEAGSYGWEIGYQTGSVFERIQALRCGGTGAIQVLARGTSRALQFVAPDVEGKPGGTDIGLRLSAYESQLLGLASNDLATAVQLTSATKDFVVVGKIAPNVTTAVSVDSNSSDNIIISPVGGTISDSGTRTTIITPTEIKLPGALSHDGSTVGFYGTAPVAKQTGVAVSAAGIHAALVNLGLISA